METEKVPAAPFYGRGSRFPSLLAAFFLASFVGLIVFFVLYLHAARRNIETSIAAGLPGFGREVASAVRAELDAGMDLQGKIASLEERNRSLEEKAARFEKENRDLEKKVRDTKRLLDLRRAELDHTQKMYNELASRVKTGEAESGTGAGEAPGKGSAGGKGTGAGSGDTAVSDGGVPPSGGEDPAADMREVLIDLNKLFDRAGYPAVRVAEFKSITDKGIISPSVSVKNFTGNRTAVLLPGILTVLKDGGKIRITNRGGGTCTLLGGKTESLSEGAIDLSFTPEDIAAVTHPRLRRLFGLDPTPGGDSPPGSASSSAAAGGGGESPASPAEGSSGVSGTADILSRLNELLDRERGRKFRFISIGPLEGGALSDVRFEEYDTKGDLRKGVEAKKCRFWLYYRDRYIVIQFEDGFIIQGGKRSPFYDGRYRITFPNIDRDRWRGAGFSFLMEQ